MRRLGRARLARFLYRHSRGAWGDHEAAALLAAAEETLAIWDEELEYVDLAEDIALEARLALQVTDEIHELDERIRVLMAKLDPMGIITSAPGVALINGAAILGRLGDPCRFRSLAGVRSCSGLVPSLDSSGLSARHGGPTKRGDAILREALFMAAQHARRTDPSLAARYHRLMVESGKHHNSALCNIAATLLTRIVACWREGKPYTVRNLNGDPISVEEGRQIVAARFLIPDDIRQQRRTLTAARNLKLETGRRSQESLRAPSSARPIANATPVLRA